jgi:hypothetical protein
MRDKVVEDAYESPSVWDKRAERLVFRKKRNDALYWLIVDNRGRHLQSQTWRPGSSFFKRMQDRAHPRPNG